MDVSRRDFWPRLLQMLEAMSVSHFVSFDCEMSGVTSRSSGPSRGKRSLQERYTETAEAAKRYQILQIGLTFAVQDEDQDTYVLRPYNMPINPCFEVDLDLERIFSFQTGAVDFLLKNGFNLQEPFKDGLPYLSRDEAQVAKQKAKAREDKGRFENIFFAENDIQGPAFVEKIRAETNEWLKTGKPDIESFNIVSVNSYYRLHQY